MSEPDARPLIGGVNAVVAAIDKATPLARIHLAVSRRDTRIARVREAAEAAGIQIVASDMDTLDRLLPDMRHQGCIAEIARLEAYRESDLPDLLSAPARPSVLALDQVQDPHNLGACLRCAAAAGVTAVIAPRKRAAGLSPAVRKVAAGAAERMPFVPVTNLSRALSRLQAEGFWAVGLAGEAEASLYDTTLPDRLVLVVGGEARGVRELTARQCDLMVRIPMASGIESLNVSVATGIALFEARRRQQIR